MKKILITGAGGFIGKALTLKLAKFNKIIAIDNNARGNLNDIKHKNIKIIKKDVTKPFDKKKFNDIDEIIHLAALNGTDNFYNYPKNVFEVGIYGCINTVKLANQINIKKFTLFSTSEIYSNPQTIPTSENVAAYIPDIQNPRFSYSGSKIFSELMIHHTLNKKITKIIIRPHNIYGPNMGTKHIIPEVFIKIINSKSIKINLNLQGTGNETRSFCFIDDFIEAFTLINKKNVSGVYNIGNNEELKIKELIKIIEKVSEVKIKKKFSLITQPHSPNRRCPDISKIEEIGYKQSFPIDKGLKITFDWYKKNLEKFHFKKTIL